MCSLVTRIILNKKQLFVNVAKLTKQKYKNISSSFRDSYHLLNVKELFLALDYIVKVMIVDFIVIQYVAVYEMR